MMEFTVLHLFAGIGGAALGFQDAIEEYRGIVGRFRTLAGIDVDPEACVDFEALTGAPPVQMDLFTREDYETFHGSPPPAGWQEATAADLLAATGGEHPDVVFLSPPCKGFSGLLPNQKAASEKYQALNRLVVRGLALTMEAFEDDPPAVIMLENVPRITSRGEWLLKQVKRLLGVHGYLFHEGYHDCGELGGLAQHRRRYLMIARLPQKVSSFVYRPPRRRVRPIGEVIGPLPMPDDPAGGPMHRLPRLQWKTWVRLALIPAGGDWRDLEKIAPEQYRLEYVPRGGGPYGVQDWDQPAATVVGNASYKGSNAACISDPRLPQRDTRHGIVYKVVDWDEPGPCVTGTRFGSGSPAVADPRVGSGFSNKRRVHAWDQPAGTITGTADIQAGAPSVADPRLPFNNIFKVTAWDDTPGTVTSGSGQTGISVADPRLGCRARNGSYGVLAWDKPSTTVTGAGDVHAGSAAVADPRIPADDDRPDPPPIIIALDGTWHRPLTTLELAVLQGFPAFLPDGRPLVLAGRSDAKWRERIGNAVPPPAARAIAGQILRALMLSRFGAWELSVTPVWVRGTDTALEEAGSNAAL